MRPSRSLASCTCSRLPLQCGSLLPAREMSISRLTLPARRVTLVLAGCLYVKYHQRVLWFVRTHRGTGGTYLVVHYSNGWTAMFLLFLGVLQGYIWCGKSGQTIEIRVLTAEVALDKPSSTIRGSLPSTRTCGVKSSGCPAGPPSGSLPGVSASRVSMLFSRSGVGRLTLKRIFCRHPPPRLVRLAGSVVLLPGLVHQYLCPPRARLAFYRGCGPGLGSSPPLPRIACRIRRDRGRVSGAARSLWASGSFLFDRIRVIGLIAFLSAAMATLIPLCSEPAWVRCSPRALRRTCPASVTTFAGVRISYNFPLPHEMWLTGGAPWTVFVTYLIATVLLEGVLCLTALLHLVRHPPSRPRLLSLTFLGIAAGAAADDARTSSAGSRL